MSIFQSRAESCDNKPGGVGGDPTELFGVYWTDNRRVGIIRNQEQYRSLSLSLSLSLSTFGRSAIPAVTSEIVTEQCNRILWLSVSIQFALCNVYPTVFLNDYVCVWTAGVVPVKNLSKNMTVRDCQPLQKYDWTDYITKCWNSRLLSSFINLETADSWSDFISPMAMYCCNLT